MNNSGIRTAGLALVTLLGAAHLSVAEATPLNLGTCDGVDTCDENAARYAQIYCHSEGQDNWSTVTYWCDGNTAHVTYVTCSSSVPEEPKS